MHLEFHIKNNNLESLFKNYKISGLSIKIFIKKLNTGE